ncbi:MAG: cation:proton antiporter [Actinobacteria bacterium]|nr:cation:proton antiporter [Actinomycetota bacterium]
MTVVAWICGLLLMTSAVLTLIAALRSPTVADRSVAVDVLVSVAIGAACVGAVASGDGVFSDLAVVLALVGFLGAVVAARFIDRRGL